MGTADLADDTVPAFSPWSGRGGNRNVDFVAPGAQVIGSVTLDGSGFGSSSHAPTKNTRIEARTDGGLYSGQPLIQVRSVASVNVTRASRT